MDVDLFEDFPYTEPTPDEDEEMALQIWTYFGESSLKYSMAVRMRSEFPKNPREVAEKLVDKKINLEVLKITLRNEKAASLLSHFMEKPAILKLVLVENGLMKAKRKPDDATKVSKKKKTASKSFVEEISSNEFDFADIRSHRVFFDFASWLGILVSKWALSETKNVFRKAFAKICAHIAALLAANPNADLAPLLTKAYLARVTGFTEKVFTIGNGGIVLIGLDEDEFDKIAEKFIKLGGKRSAHHTEMKKEWNDKAVEILKQRDAKDPLIKMMLHWTSGFFKEKGLYIKFASN